MELIPLPMRVAGLGVVSPAGWGTADFLRAVRAGTPLPHGEVRRMEGAPAQQLRRVPKPSTPHAFARDPRVRRASAITRFAVAAALEALGEERVAAVRAGRRRVGVIAVMLNGCVTYSRRFYGEVRENPVTASPLLFPETVFNAPASHLAAMIGSGLANSTIVGDTAQFAAALDMASLWLEAGEVDGVLLVAAEEADWLSGEAAMLFDRRCVMAEGAGALFLESAKAPGIVLQRPVPVGHGHSRRAAAMKVRDACREIGASPEFGTAPECGVVPEGDAWLCDGLIGAARTDAAERAAFADWAGPRLSCGRVLGDALGVRTAWQCVLAAAMVADGTAPAACVPAIGNNQQALGVAFFPAPAQSGSINRE